MKTKLTALICVLLCVLCLTGCSKPTEPPNPEELPKALQLALNTGCTMDNAYIGIDKFLPMARPFIPVDIMGKAIPIINIFHKALNTYNSAVIAWHDAKTEPQDINQLLNDLNTAYQDALPIIQQIIDALKRNDSEPESLERELKAGLLTCTFDEFKIKAAQVKALPDIV